MQSVVLRRQSGVAVVTALLLTTLAITIVASLFWQQQVQVRSIENQRFQLQKKWVLRGALDWAGLILREDRRISKVDHLGEPWAVNLGDTRLDQYVENGRTEVEDSDATLSGQISDAQAKFNLTNLAVNGKVDVRELAVFSKLLSNLHLDPGLAQQVAVQVAMTQERLLVGPENPGAPDTGQNPTGSKGSQTSSGTGVGGSKTTPGGGDSTVGLSTSSNSEVQFLKFSQIEDLLAVPGFNPVTIVRLRNFVTVLPILTKINVNTTTAEVLSASLENVSMTDAALMIATRDRAYFLNFAQFKLNFPDKVKDTDSNFLDFQTNFFVVNGKVKLNRSLLEVDALLQRDDVGTRILWIKEN
ncbi:type II secretion system minor pseudopilin GspK [Undibacterium flavidum]|uniref:Type II secretion system protein K n=1 Tax=Undibacterium flavidum TaxID=2762297 RepID=A0ABR6Y6N1_9BURK|nr:type II secretion system minor pseudopilin GspK [Undibacterium flavidum]MBC3872250.1 type II secretion system minor pseudopilin GspK [Undibacterium flavidum]